MADERMSDRRDAPPFADLRIASRRLRSDISTALHHLFDAAVRASAPSTPAVAPVIVRRDRRRR